MSTIDTRELLAPDLSDALVDARARSLELIASLDDEQITAPPKLPTINPLLWEIGHVAWFQEFWTCRRDGEPSILPDADELFGSITIPHQVRWSLPYPDRAATLAYVEQVRDRVLETLGRCGGNPEDLFHQAYAIFHEDMHFEAFVYTFQTLGWKLPIGGAAKPEPGGSAVGDASFVGGKVVLGATSEDGMVFDNEKWAQEVDVAPFRIGRIPVTQAQFLEFVADGGYQRDEFWSPSGQGFRAEFGLSRPAYWSVRDGRTMRRRFDEVVPLEPDHPVIHISAYEAEAYCRWAGRRLPTEAEWEAAALHDPATGAKRRFPWGDDACLDRSNADSRVGDTVSVHAHAAGDSALGCRQMIGNVWEWTADWFRPFAGFVADPYTSYSQISFDLTRVMKGGSHVSRSRLVRGGYRNFFQPFRFDVPVGFRTCAL